MRSRLIRILLINLLLLIYGTATYAVTDTLSYIGRIKKKDTTESFNMFRRFHWNVSITYRDGKKAHYTSAHPDTLFEAGHFVKAELTADVLVDSTLLNRIVSVNYDMEGSAEMRLNDKVIFATGDFQKKRSERKYISYDYLDLVFNEPLQRIAVNYKPYKPGDFDISILLMQQEYAHELNKEDEIASFWSLSKGSYYIAFSIVFLTLFVFYREKKEHFYFAMFCLFGGLSFLWEHLDTDLLYHVDSFFGVYCFEFLSIFFYKVLKNKEKSRLPLIIITALFLICLLPQLRYWTIFTRIGSSLRQPVPWFVSTVVGALYFYSWLSAFIYLVKGVGDKRWEARAILATCLLPIILFVVVFIVYLLVLAATATDGMIDISLPAFISYFPTTIVYLYPLGAVFILGRRNGLNQVKLSAQVKSIQQLSEENLAKEREKQDILTGQKEALEKEVAQRTAEIVAQKERIEAQNSELIIEKEKSDDLLRNILPEEVAEELKEKGATTAKHYDDVTVLFTDFMNFTQASERMDAQHLIDELNVCFKAFDEITARYKIEKIKTIGDAYLAVAGLPAPDENHAVHIVKAAKEIIAFMEARMEQMGPGKTFSIRVGVHSGGVVAGIVGLKKFAYDIWGDTVNTAARMEQNSEAGKINISHATYELIKDTIPCEYRGEIAAKNKGAMKMYYVS